MDEFVTVYDQDGKLLAVLENAGDVGFELKHNDLWTGSFTLPAGDPKNAFCQAHNLVRLPDGTRDLGLYRIISMPSSEETAIGGKKTYSVEHVMATLLDDVLFGYHEVGGTGVNTRQVMEYILARQTTARWQLGTVDFTGEFQYHFENVSLLSALLSLGEVLTDEYTWEFDTDTTPWTVHLRRADQTPGCGIHYGRNLVEIQKTMDASALVTRLYPLGYGEGVNQLTIRGVNNGLPYIDADTAAVWGVKCSVWTDTRITDAETLKARAAQVLEGFKNPYITYTAKAIDLARLTGYSWDEFMPGKLVRVMDGEHGIGFEARIVGVRKDDLLGDPGGVEITIANAPRDAADSLNTLADRVGIGELYSQGATNLFAIPFNDNADAQHPAKMKVYVPGGLVRINRMLLTWQTAPFRAYSTGAASGGSSSQTSSSGGGSTETSSTTDQVTYASEQGGDCTVTTPVTVVQPGPSASIGSTGGAYDAVSGNEMKVTTNATDASGAVIPVQDFNTGSAGSHYHSVNSHSHTGPSHYHSVDSHHHGMSHRHNIAAHDHSISEGATKTGGTALRTATPIEADSLSAKGYTDNASSSTGYAGTGSTGSSSPSTDAQGSHSHSAPQHYHGMNHYHFIAGFTIPAMSVNVPAHGHNVKIPGHSHTVAIPAHTHSVSIPGHSHGIVYGIYEGSSAQNVTIRVDGTDVPASAITGSELDVSAWLAKDSDGRITRNAWHEIQIVPDGLTRIEAHLFAQCFIQSVGGGDY